MNAEQWFTKLNNVLGATVVTERTTGDIKVDDGINLLLEYSKRVFASGNTLFFAGNGASAAMASHYALDFWKNGGIKAQTFFDLSQITAISNDIAYDQVFSLPLTRFAGPGDVFIGISSSGNSPNIVQGAAKARELGLTVIGFSGFKPDNKLRALSDLSFYVPADSYGFVETAHAALLHIWIDAVMNAHLLG